MDQLAAVVPSAFPWISLYWLFAIICLAMIGIITLSRFPIVKLSEEEEVGALQTHLDLFKDPTVILFFLGIFCYVGTEQGVVNWMSQYLNTYYGYNPQSIGAQEVSYFWGLLTAGSVLGLGLLKIMDSRKVLIGFTVATLISLSFSLFGGRTTALYAFPLIGFFASVMYPVIFSLALNSFEEHHGAFSGILVTGIIGGAIVPLLIGWLGDIFSLRTGMFFLYITVGYILSIGFWSKPIITNKTIDLSHRDTAEDSLGAKV